MKKNYVIEGFQADFFFFLINWIQFKSWAIGWDPPLITNQSIIWRKISHLIGNLERIMMAPSTPICLLPPLFFVCLAFFFFCFFRLCLSPLLFIIWPICGLMAGIPALLIVKKSWLHWKFRANSSQMGCMWEIWWDSKWAPPRGVAQAKESAVGPSDRESNLSEGGTWTILWA